MAPDLSVYPADTPRLQKMSETGFIDVGYRYIALLAGMSAFGSSGISPLVWAAIYGLCLVFVTLRFGATLHAIIQNVPLVLFPLICGISVLWSVAPSSTITYSLMLVFTYLVAFQIGMAATPRQILTALGHVLIFIITCSLLNLFEVFSNPWDHRNNFKGVLASKNTLGHAMVLLILVSVFETFRSRPAGLAARAVWTGLGFLAFYVAFLADSAAALACAVAYGTALAAAMVLLRTGVGTLFMLGLASLFSSAVLTVLGLIHIPLTELVFRLLSRDSTMTGRTVIWDIGWNVFSERPLLGYGANAFWHWERSTNLVDALQSQFGEQMLAFHNVTIEVLVMLGPVGLSAIAFGFLFIVGRAIRALFGWDPEIVLLILAILAFLLTISLLDVALYKEHSVTTMLPIALGVSLGRYTEMSDPR